MEASSQQLSSRSGAMSESEASDSTSPTTPTSTQAESQTEPKYDGGKDRWDLLPMGAMRLVVKALTVGAKKYSGWSWVDQVQAPVPRYYAAAMRHVERWQAGERYDPETGLPHLAHALASLTFVMCHEEGLGVPVWVRRGE